MITCLLHFECNTDQSHRCHFEFDFVTNFVSAVNLDASSRLVLGSNHSWFLHDFFDDELIMVHIIISWTSTFWAWS